jgi:hypothetical protein
MAPYWQWETFRNAASWARGGTFKPDKLPTNGLLSGLLVHAYRAGVTDSMIATQKWRLLDWVSKLEVVGDGGDAIKSLTGQMNHYMSWLALGGAAPDKHFNYGSSTKRMHTFIPFGRYMFDKDYGLDLSRWKSMELQFTNDGDATYFAGDWSVDVMLLWLRDAPAGQFKGFFETKEWRSITVEQNKTEYLVLPTKYPIRRIALQVLPPVDANMAAKITPYNVAKTIKLTKKSGQHKMFEDSLRQLWYVNYFANGRDVFQPLEPYTSDEIGVHTGLGQTLGEAGLRLSHSSAQSTYGTTIEPGDDASTLRRVVNSDSDQDALIVQGLALENCACFDFDPNYDPSEWLDPQADADVELDLTSADSADVVGGTYRVVLDRFRTGPTG